MNNDMDAEHVYPKARTDRLVVEELDGEVLIYDKKHHRAHCLNDGAVLVWRLADGETSVAAMVRELPSVDLPRDESVVWMALERLERAELMEEPVALPLPRAAYSRKHMLKMLGRAAGLLLVLPAVDSVGAPLAAQAASCITKAQCKALNPNNCTGLPICGKKNKCCVRKKEGKKGKVKWECDDEKC